MKPFITALLLADRSGNELEPLNLFYPPALLPIAGKSPLVYWIEALYAQGIRKLYIVIGPHRHFIKEKIGSGNNWGVKITYLTSEGDEEPYELFKRHQSILPNNLLVVRADVLPRVDAQGEVFPSVKLCANTSEEITLLLSKLNWNNIKIKDQSATRLGDFQQYVCAIWNTLGGSYPWLIPEGFKVASTKWLAAADFSVSRTDRLDSIFYMGKSATLHRDINLTNNLCIEHNVHIDCGATIDNTVILPGTYVGQNISVKDAIICGDFLIDTNTGLAHQFDNPKQLSHIEKPGAIVSTYRSERMAAATILILTAPIILPLAFLTRQKGESILQTNQAMSNQSFRKKPFVFEHYFFNTRISWLRRWPALMNVIDGDLKLVGSPITTVDQESLSDLPLAQGVFTARDIFPQKEFDEIELEHRGFELACEDLGYWVHLKRVFIRIFTNGIAMRTQQPSG